MKRVAVVMAGGAGERFWPMSRVNRPKQLLDLTSSGKALLQTTIERILPVIPHERILVTTGKEQAAGVSEMLSDLPPENVLVEPARRNTAACIGFACAYALARWGSKEGISMAVFPSDPLIAKPEKYQQSVESALEFAESSNSLVTIGIQPGRPETGYGYIKIGDDVAQSTPAGDIHAVARFVEKPDANTATEYVADGRYLWNSGMFFWSSKAFLEGLAAHMPRLAKAVGELEVLFSSKASTGETERTVTEIYNGLDNISIDYGLMERSDNVYVLPADFGWDDIGSWDSLCRINQADDSDNILEGDPIIIDSQRCLVLNKSGSDKLSVAVLGVQDLIIVNTEDALLVCSRSRSQEVKKIVEALKARGDSKFL